MNDPQYQHLLAHVNKIDTCSIEIKLNIGLDLRSNKEFLDYIVFSRFPGEIKNKFVREFGTEVPKLDVIINNILKITRKVLLLRDNVSTVNKVVHKSNSNPPTSTIATNSVTINKNQAKKVNPCKFARKRGTVRAYAISSIRLMPGKM